MTININELRKQIKECDMNSDYAFVSYSKKDAEYVYPVVINLQKQGYNLWIDKELTEYVGENWQEKVIEAIKSVNCKCVLFFVSKNSILSTPVFAEICYCISDIVLEKKMEETKIIPITTSDEWRPEKQRLSEWIKVLVNTNEGKKKLEPDEYKMLKDAGLNESFWKKKSTMIETHGELASHLYYMHFLKKGGDNDTFAYYKDVETIISNIPKELCVEYLCYDNKSETKAISAPQKAESMDDPEADGLVSETKCKKGQEEKGENNTITVTPGNWGPERDVFSTKDKVDHVTFNSVIDNEEIGDERNFVRIREVGDDKFVNEVKVVAGKEYEVFIYFHNNGDYDLNQTGKVISSGTRLSSYFPSHIRPLRKDAVGATLTSVNAFPNQVWDEAFLLTDSDDPIELKFVPGSATLHNKWKANNSVMSTNLFTQKGVYIGVNELNGLLPAGKDFAGYITYKLRALKAVPDAEIKMLVSKDGTNFYDTLNVQNEDEIICRIDFKNTGDVDIKNVTFFAELPEGMKLIKKTTVLTNKNYPNGEIMPDVIDKNGFNTGTYASGAKIQLTFRLKIENVHGSKEIISKVLFTNKIVNIDSFEEEFTKTTSVTVNIDDKDATIDQSTDDLKKEKIVYNNGAVYEG